MTAVYIHFPFCLQRCQYCDFITYANLSHFIPAYLEAVKKEISLMLRDVAPADTVYFGGGTPSLLSAEQVGELLSVIDQAIGISDDAEITLEANPGTVNIVKLRNMRQSGVNRLSFGVQSFFDDELEALGRIHSADQAKAGIREAQLAGFENISLDLIFGLPGQSLKTWEENMRQVSKLGIQHLSLYSLIIEPGTPFERLFEEGKLNLPEDDLVADMFELAMSFLPKFGFEQYEISSWALGIERESRHNKIYWQNNDYFGIGAGAAGKIGNQRYQNLATIPEYIGKMKQASGERSDISPAADEVLEIDERTAMQESLMLGLRMTREGVSATAFKSRYNQDMRVVFGGEIGRILQNALAEWRDFPDGEHLVLTHRGIMLGNQAFQEFVD